jgi:hypothetical protein
MNGSRKLLFAAALFGTAIFGSTHVNATDMDIDATMTASAAVTVAKNADLDFGGIDFITAHLGTVELGPDGNAALGGGSTNLTLTGTPVAGEMAITSSAGVIEVTCDATATIGDGSTDLTLTTVKWDTSAATYGAATNTCGGLGAGAVTIDTAVSNDPTIYVGAELTIGNNALNGSSGSTAFDTSTGGGDPVTFRFVFQ